MNKFVVLIIFLSIPLYAGGPTDLYCDQEAKTEARVFQGQDFRAWTAISSPSGTADRLTHATVYNPDDDLIYMIGGTPDGTSGSMIADNYSYDPNSDSWTTLTPMPENVGWLDGVYYNGHIYVAGGYTNSGGASNQMKIYGVSSDSWSIGGIPGPRMLAYAAELYNGSLYCVGGYPATPTQTNRYDIATGGWSTATDLPQGFDMGGSCIIDNVIYLVGGYNRGGGVVYSNIYEGVINPSDPDDITWSMGDALPAPNFLNGCDVLNGRICMLGGFLNGSTPTNQFQIYDPGVGWTADDTYPVSVVRNNFFVCRDGTNEVYGIAGDANGDWSPPNNYYNMDDIDFVAEQTEQTVNKTSLNVTPNVSNRVTTVSFSIPSSGRVTVDLYNANGQKVMNLYRGSATTHAVRVSLNNTPAGVYFVNLEADGSVTSEKLVVTK